MSIIQEDEYTRFMAGEDQWWEPFGKEAPPVHDRKEALLQDPLDRDDREPGQERQRQV